MNLCNITTVIINYQTPDLVERAVTTFRRAYFDAPLLLIDNGSLDQSVNVLQKLLSRSTPPAELLHNKRNIHHGPAMDQALRYLQSSFVLFIDSDCEIKNGGFLELMSALLEEKPDHYIAGKMVYMNRRGFDVENAPGALPYIRPMCMMVKRSTYLALPPFQRHGTPCLDNMKRAVECGHSLVDFPVEEYVSHAGRGTVERHGYHLGWRGKLNYLLNKAGW